VLTAVLARGRLAGPALFTLATEYAIVEATGHAPAASVIGYAAGLILVSELLLWAAQLPRTAAADRAVAAVHLTTLAAIALAAAVLALAVLAAGGLRLPGALAAALLGTAAAVALLALPWLLLRRPGSPGTRKRPAGAPGSGAPAPGGGQAT
jgi:hypothetical protein